MNKIIFVLLTFTLIPTLSAETIEFEEDGMRWVFEVEREPVEVELRVFGYNPDPFAHAKQFKVPQSIFSNALIIAPLGEVNRIYENYLCESKAMAFTRLEYVLPASEEVREKLREIGREEEIRKKASGSSRSCMKLTVGKVRLTEFYPHKAASNTANESKMAPLAEFPSSYPVVMYATDAQPLNCDEG